MNIGNAMTDAIRGVPAGPGFFRSVGRSVGGRLGGYGKDTLAGLGTMGTLSAPRTARTLGFMGRHPRTMIGGGLAAGAGMGYVSYRSSGRDGLRGRSSGGY